MEPTKAILLTLLAEERALFRPFRSIDWTTPGMSAVVWERQLDYREKGLPWTQTGGDAERKANQRVIAELIQRRLVKPYGGAKRTHLALSNRGRAMAVALANVPGDDAGWATVKEVLRFSRKPGVLVAELLLARLPAYSADQNASDALWVTEALALPGLVQGWLIAHSDYFGRAYYMATTTGADIVARPEPRPTERPPKTTEEAESFFDVTFAEARRRLQNAKPTNARDLGILPLTASPGDTVIGPWNWQASDSGGSFPTASSNEFQPGASPSNTQSVQPAKKAQNLRHT